MLTFDERKTVFFDVDDTILEWKSCNPGDQGSIITTNNGQVFHKRAISPNIEALKSHFLAGHIVVVWSAGGSTWAKTVIEALRLQDYVNVILNKPDFYYDDKDASHWLPYRQFKV